MAPKRAFEESFDQERPVKKEKIGQPQPVMLRAPEKSGSSLTPQEETMGGYALLLEGLGKPIREPEEGNLFRKGAETQREVNALLPLGPGNQLDNIRKTNYEAMNRNKAGLELSKALYKAFKKKVNDQPLDAQQDALFKCWPEGIIKDLCERGYSREERVEYGRNASIVAGAMFAKSGLCEEISRLTAVLHAPKLEPGQRVINWQNMHEPHMWPAIGVKNEVPSDEGPYSYKRGMSLEMWKGDWKSPTPTRAKHANHDHDNITEGLAVSHVSGSFSLDAAEGLLKGIEGSDAAKGVFNEALQRHVKDSKGFEEKYAAYANVAQAFSEALNREPSNKLLNIFSDPGPLLSEKFRRKIADRGILDQLKAKSPSEIKVLGTSVGKTIGLSSDKALNAEENYKSFLRRAEELTKITRSAPSPSTPIPSSPNPAAESYERRSPPPGTPPYPSANVKSDYFEMDF